MNTQNNSVKKDGYTIETVSRPNAPILVKRIVLTNDQKRALIVPKVTDTPPQSKK